MLTQEEKKTFRELAKMQYLEMMKIVLTNYSEFSAICNFNKTSKLIEAIYNKRLAEIEEM